MVTVASEPTKEDAMNHDSQSGDFQVGDFGSVFRESRLRETDDQLAETRHKNRRLVNSLGEAREQIASLKQEVDRLCAPPASYGVYLSDNCDGTINVLSQGRKVKVSLRPSLRAEDVEKVKGFFLNIKGPELLNKYVGETERKIREIFIKAREKAAEDVPVVVFFDEMDALFRTRGSGISSDVETTIVPQLLAEIDGVEHLKNVIVIGASNRQDLIDPAILRPGRL